MESVFRTLALEPVGGHHRAVDRALVGVAQMPVEDGAALALADAFPSVQYSALVLPERFASVAIRIVFSPSRAPTSLTVFSHNRVLQFATDATVVDVARRALSLPAEPADAAVDAFGLVGVPVPVESRLALATFAVGADLGVLDFAS